MLKCGTSLVPIKFLHIQSFQLFYFAIDVPTGTLKKGPNDPAFLSLLRAIIVRFMRRVKLSRIIYDLDFLNG